MKKSIAILLIMTLIVTFVPANVCIAANHTIKVGDGDFDFTAVSQGDTITVETGASVKIIGDGSPKYDVKIICETGVTVEIENIVIRLKSDDIRPMLFTGNNNKLIISGVNELNGSNDCAAIAVYAGSSLEISGTGELTAKGGWRAAGIGGDIDDGSGVNLDNADGGDITIKSGTITVRGGSYSAGIGGAGIKYYSDDGGDGGTVIIEGGTVTATGNFYNYSGSAGGAGIGGGGSTAGTGGYGGTVEIYGGTVIATGGGYKADSGGGAGIGGGGGYDRSGGDGGTVNIYGGKVIAIGATNAAGIGGGGRKNNNSSYKGGKGADVSITGGCVAASISNDYGYSAVGAGFFNNDLGTLTVNEDAILILGKNNIPSDASIPYPAVRTELLLRGAELTWQEVTLTDTSSSLLELPGGTYNKSPLWVYLPPGDYQFLKPEPVDRKSEVFTISDSEFEQTLNMVGRDAPLSSLSVNGLAFTESFSPDKHTYTTMPTNNSSVQVYANKKDSYSTLTGDGVHHLDYGDNTLTVTCTAEDGVSKTKYYINIHRTSNVDTLSNLLADSQAVAGFNSNTYSYDLGTVNTPTININAVATDNVYAQVTGHVGVQNLSLGNNTLTITVTADNGVDTQDYILTVFRVNNDASLCDLTVNGETISGFAPETLNYDLGSTNQDTITIGRTATDVNAVVTGDSGAKSLSFSQNTFTITVTAQDGTTTQEYVISVYRNNTDATLSDLKVNSSTIEGFAAGKYSYNLGTVNQSSLNVEAILADSNASLAGDTGDVDLALGSNTLTVTVTAQDGVTTNDYTIEVYRMNIDATLSDLTVDGKTVSGFDAETLIYELGDVDSETITISATPTDTNAAASGNIGVVSLALGQNTFTVTVTAQDGTTTKDYAIRVYRNNTDATLSSLKVNGKAVSGFSSETFTYDLGDVDSETITISAIPTDSNAAASGNIGVVSLALGQNTFTVTVTAQDGKTTKDYVISVYRNNTDATLSSLKADGKAVSGFAPETFSYNLGAVNSETITISASPTDSNAAASGYMGVVGLALGQNTFTITVTAQNGKTTKDYVISVYRNNTDATLSSLKVNGKTIEGFSPETLAYDLGDVEYSSITISVKAADNNATVTAPSEGAHLPVGKNAFTITVTAQDGITVRKYTVTVTRISDEPEEDKTLPDLEKLSISGIDFTPAFSPQITEYTSEVPHDTKTIQIDAAAKEDFNVNIVGSSDGTIELDVGENKITIEVTNGDEKTTYTVIVTRCEKEETSADAPQQTDSLDVVESDDTSIAPVINARFTDEQGNAIDAADLEFETLKDGTVTISNVPTQNSTLVLENEDGENTTIDVQYVKADEFSWQLKDETVVIYLPEEFEDVSIVLDRDDSGNLVVIDVEATPMSSFTKTLEKGANVFGTILLVVLIVFLLAVLIVFILWLIRRKRRAEER